MSELQPGVLIERHEGVVTITFNHPERANALDPNEFHALADVLAGLAAETGMVAVVLTGRGDRAFCAGLNLCNAGAIQADLASMGPTGLGATLRAAAGLGIPLIGRINGACVAGGLGLVGACDYVISVDTARFGLPEIAHGIYPHVAMAGLHGRGAATVVRRLADTGTMIDAAAALDAGLVDEVVHSAELEAGVGRVLSRIQSDRMPPRFLTRCADNMAVRHARLDEAEAAARQGISKIVNS